MIDRAKKLLSDAPELKRVSRGKRFQRACRALGVLPEEILDTVVTGPTSASRFATLRLRAVRRARVELLVSILTRKKEIEDDDRKKRDRENETKHSFSGPPGSNDRYMIDDSAEEALAERRRKRQLERRSKQRLQRAREKREKLQAVVRRRHDMRLEEIRAKRAAQERLKNDIVRSRRRRNAAHAARVSAMIDAKVREREERQQSIRDSLRARFDRVEAFVVSRTEDRRRAARETLRGSALRAVKVAEAERMSEAERRLRAMLARSDEAAKQKNDLRLTNMCRRTIRGDDRRKDARRRRLARSAERARRVLASTVEKSDAFEDAASARVEREIRAAEIRKQYL